MHYGNPPTIMFGETRAKVGRTVKAMLGADMVDEVVPISNQDAEAQFGSEYKRLAQMNMLRSEKVSVLTGDNPFLREKMDMKKADMGDVIDDFKKSDAPQFQGKSMAKRRQMAIAAKLNSEGAMKRMATQDDERERLGPRKVKGMGLDTFKKKPVEPKNEDVKLSEAMVDQKLIKTLKAMMKDGEDDSVRLLIQGLPRNMKKDVMKKIGMKEQVDGRTKAFKETISRLNMAKIKEAAEDEMKVDGYQTKHFYLCPSAKKAMTEHMNVDGAKELTKMQDEYFKFEKKFMSSEPSEADKEKAQSMYESIIEKAEAAGIKEDVDSYMKDHRDSITKGDPKPGFGKVEEDVNEDKSLINVAKKLKGASKKHAKQADVIMKHVDKMDEKTADEQEAEGGGHIVMQLRKSVSMRGQKDVKFNDGSTHKVSAAHANKFLSKHASLKTSHDKRALQKQAAKSHDHLQKSIREEDLEERTPVRPTVQDKKQKNLRVPNPNYKSDFNRPEKKKRDTFKEYINKDEVGIDKPEEATEYTSMDFFKDYIKVTNKK
tara:strand:+ start:5406 stop:7034 length:1629 start_codon:yes stop_codon:yes gene_type:complete